ncbi:hypothetical protein [Janthinobacterium sp. LB2P70]|uniref:hypothetical protein n=1 Tax=Janthinobacterium sp. LB2P70 TaxID=3424197 RepID=UPI003F203A8E
MISATRQVTSFAQLARGKSTLLAPKVGWYGADHAAARPALEKDGRLNTFGGFRQGILMLDAGPADLARLNAAITRLEQRGVLVAIRSNYERRSGGQPFDAASRISSFVSRPFFCTPCALS